VSDLAVRLEAASVRFPTAAGDEVLALQDVSWSLPRGASAAVVGRSGSGKSTLISLLSLMRTPTEGVVEVLGRRTDELSARAAATLRARQLGVVFQAFHLDERQPVWWNVALPWVFGGRGSLRRARRRAGELLEQVGLPGVEGRRATELSGGQRQRVAIARALMARPSLLVADEPTGNLDEDTADDVVRLLYGLTEQGVTVVVVTHDLDVAAQAQVVVRLERGRLAVPAA
jgi:ABC-type lipoprotein export system ATPase subunit